MLKTAEIRPDWYTWNLIERSANLELMFLRLPFTNLECLAEKSPSTNPRQFVIFMPWLQIQMKKQKIQAMIPTSETQQSTYLHTT